MSYPNDVAAADALHQKYNELKKEISKVIVGQDQIVEAFLNPDLPSDLTLDLETINVSVSEDQEILITATAIPLIDTEKLVQDLLGLKEERAFDLLQSIPRAYRYTLTYQPELPSFLKALPRRPQNIKIDVNQ